MDWLIANPKQCMNEMRDGYINIPLMAQLTGVMVSKHPRKQQLFMQCTSRDQRTPKKLWCISPFVLQLPPHWHWLDRPYILPEFPVIPQNALSELGVPIFMAKSCMMNDTNQTMENQTWTSLFFLNMFTLHNIYLNTDGNKRKARLHFLTLLYVRWTSLWMFIASFALSDWWTSFTITCMDKVLHPAYYCPALPLQSSLSRTLSVAQEDLLFRLSDIHRMKFSLWTGASFPSCYVLLIRVLE